MGERGATSLWKALLAAPGAVLPCATAQAIDLTAKASLTETVEANSNYFLAPSPSGITYRPLSTLGVDLLARSPTATYDLKSSFSYYNLLGPGAADASFTSATQNSVTAGAEFTGHPAADKLYVTGSWSRADVSQTRLTETGIAGGLGDINVFSAETGVKHQLNALDSFVLSVRGLSAEFSAAGSAPFTDVGATGVWTRRLGPVTDLITSVRYDWQAAEGAAPIRNNFWQATTGVQTQLSKRLSFFATAGVAVAEVSQGNINVNQPVTTAPAAPNGSATEAGLLWNTSLTYRLATTDVSLTSSQSSGPNALGSLQKSTTVGLSARHAINPASTFRLSGNFFQTTLANATFDSYSAQAAYTRQLTREWQTGIAYEFRQRIGETSTVGSASSNAVKVFFTTDKVFRP